MRTKPSARRLAGETEQEGTQEVEEDAELAHDEIGFAGFVAVGQEFVGDG